MARGWESKAVEEQIESSQSSGVSQHSRSAISERDHVKRSLQLSRTRVLRDIEGCQNPRYKKLLDDALADLDRKLANME